MNISNGNKGLIIIFYGVVGIKYSVVVYSSLPNLLGFNSGVMKGESLLIRALLSSVVHYLNLLIPKKKENNKNMNNVNFVGPNENDISLTCQQWVTFLLYYR